VSSSIIQHIDYIDEPELVFGSGQKLASPKDGLYLFGPLKNNSKSGDLRIGIIGTKNGVRIFNYWLSQIKGVIPAKDSESSQHRPFPGFTSVFGLNLPSKAECELIVTDNQIDEALLIGDRHVAIFKTVDVFSTAIQRYLNEEESPVDLWFVVIPERIYQYGRPKSVIPTDKRLKAQGFMNKKLAKELVKEPSLFAVDNEATEPYLYELNFHNQLKARLLEGRNRAVVQILRETAIAPSEFVKSNGMPLRQIQDPATVAWNLTTTAYFKSGRRPWQLAQIRNHVCYVGLVFKQLMNAEEGSACCGAQMFLDSGDGLVFKGLIGRWKSSTSKEFHLDRVTAQSLLTMVVEAYKHKEGVYPSELFLHGKTAFNNEEWDGFTDALSVNTKLVGIRINSTNNIKLFRPGSHPIIRGTALRLSERNGYLWTKGFIPYLNTYPGRETPNPIRIDIVRGEADLLTVMKDVMALTKLNFNACIYGDGIPVTLRFANAVGEILTAGPTDKEQPPLPFKHYI
jgi:hypothetical protein